MTVNRPHLVAMSLLAGVLAFGSAAPVLAQAEAPSPQAPAAANISEENLKTFARATKDVNRIAEQARAKLQESGEPEQAQAVQQQAQADMVEAVKKKGMSVEEYNNIATAAQTDPQLRERVIQHMEQEPN